MRAFYHGLNQLETGMTGKRSAQARVIMPHDSIQSLLEREQRTLISLASEGSLSFIRPLLPPFCPISGAMPPEGAILGPLVCVDQWLIRPVSGLTLGTWVPFAGYEGIPPVAGFIMGKFTEGNRLIEAYRRVAADSPSLRELRDEGVPLKVWRVATLSIEYEREDAYESILYAFNPGPWERAEKAR